MNQTSMFKGMALALCCCLGVWATEDIPFQIHARVDFDRMEGDDVHYRHQIFKGTVGHESLVVHSYPKGKPAVRRTLRFGTPGAGAIGHCLELPPCEENHVLVMTGMGKVISTPKLKVSFDIFVPENNPNGFQIYIGNPTKRINMGTRFSFQRGQWSTVRHIINGDGYFETGAPVTNFGLKGGWGEKRGWKLDNLVVWSGDDPTPPTAVPQLVGTNRGSQNLLTWKPATDNLFIREYRVYRGTVRNFPATEATCIGTVKGLAFTDGRLMHRDYFYQVRAVDSEGNEAESSPVVFVRQDQYPE